jgi:prepilin peptidase CpaA
MIFPLVVFIFVSIQLLFVAYVDLKTRTISNIWMLINFIFFCLLTWIFPTLYIWKVSTFIFPLAFLFVGFLLFFLKIMGGGDSKYLSSIYLLIPFSHQEQVFLYLLYTTIIVGSSLLLINIIKNLDRIIMLLKESDIMGIKRIFGKKFTYAPVIFISWMWFGWRNLSLLKF